MTQRQRNSIACPSGMQGEKASKRYAGLRCYLGDRTSGCRDFAGN